MVLLDSHVLLWLVTGRRPLGDRARTLIGSSSVHVSAATLWELTIKAMLGKLRIPDDLVDRLDDQGLATIDVTPAHALAIREFPALVRHDPFDRLLVAQASVDRMTLLTADRVLLDLGEAFIIDARA